MHRQNKKQRLIPGWFVTAALTVLLASCGGGGGSDRAPGVAAGPPPPNGPVLVPPPVAPGPGAYAQARQIFSFITAANFQGGHAVVTFQLSDETNSAITDLALEDVRFVLAKLQASPLGGSTGAWQSYVNRIEGAGGVGPGTEDRLQATYERDGALDHLGDGIYRYTFATDVTNPDMEILGQAEAEGFDLSFEPDRTHRVSIQFDSAANAVNPFYDWVPATGENAGIFNYQVSLTDNCNRCHNPLEFHGGNRIEMEYCVTCHNPATSDANSGNSLDMKVMIHKLHMGAKLPSVQAGNPLVYWGFRDSLHDYSHVRYPQDLRNCQNCHVGTGTGNGYYSEVALSNQGDNWNLYPSKAACGSCHDALDFSRHAGGQTDDSRCGSCHAESEVAGSVAFSHRQLLRDASEDYLPEILRVTNTMPGERPQIEFRINKPSDGGSWDIQNDPSWTQGGGASRLALTLSWSTSDYTNTGNESDTASAVSIDALGSAVPNGDGSFSVLSPLAIPDGSRAPGIAAEGSGAIALEGHPAAVLEEGGALERIYIRNVVDFFSIDEPGGLPTPRRDSVELKACLSCHQDIVVHGSNRSNTIQGCVNCHNPRNTDRDVREMALSPPSDGKREESINFSNMVHAIHAPALRTNPLQVVGFRGFTTYVYDEEHVQYPGRLGDCRACHGESGYELPVVSSALGVTIDTGKDLQSPADDVVISPESSACYSCHENPVAKAHMEQNGGRFDTTQSALNSGEVIEQCALCHGNGRTAGVRLVHGISDE